MQIHKFPKNFIWGTATSAYQTEGNNSNTDWWKWEQEKKPGQEFPLEPSEQACNSYNRYEEDLDLCKDLNNNAVRFSIEWARIEPQEGHFDQKEIDHYKKVLKAAKNRGLKTFITLHHFTNPIWFINKGGWHNPKCVKYFIRYSKICAKEFGHLIDAYLTINEPQVYALMSYTKGTWPPNIRNPFLSLLVQINMMRAHRKAYDAIKSIGDYSVGVVKNIVWYETDPFSSSFVDRFVAKLLYFFNDIFFLRPIIGKVDLLGLNYYFTNRIKRLRVRNPSDYGSDLEWWINPVGLEMVLWKLKRYKIPVYVTENGLADSKDRLREHFIRDMLIACTFALKRGAPLKGYFHWSLLDNFEWHQGYWPKFGLVEVDRSQNFKRKPRKSFYYYADICKNGFVKE